MLAQELKEKAEIAARPCGQDRSPVAEHLGLETHWTGPGARFRSVARRWR